MLTYGDARNCSPVRGLLAAVVAATALAAIAHAQSATGRVVGRVRLVAAHSTRPLALAYASRTLSAPGQPGVETGNVVVYLRDVPATQVPPRRFEMRQQDEMFVPRVLPIPLGSSVVFPNTDPYFHNVFSLSRAASFDLGRFPKGQSRARQFTQAGLVKVFCHLHAHMTGVVMVLDHPWFATPSSDGTFVIADVPAGRRTVSAWHERIGEANIKVEVPAGGEASVEFVLPVVEP